MLLINRFSEEKKISVKLLYTAISGNVVGKKHTSARHKTESGLGSSIEIDSDTSEIYRHNKRQFARFLSLCTCGNKVRVATLNFRRIFLTQRHATVKIGLLKGKKILHVQNYKLVHCL